MQKDISTSHNERTPTIEVDLTRGLLPSDVAKSRRLFGENLLTKTKKRTFFKLFISNLGDPIIKILIGAMLFNVIFMMKNINWPETAGIACAVLIATLVSTISEHGSERAFDRLNDRSRRSRVSVLRDGAFREIADEDIVCADVIAVGAGSVIPADCRLISGELRINEAPLTGESAHAVKRAHSLKSKFLTVDPAADCGARETTLFKGSYCVSGEGRAVVFRVGDTTEYGSIAKELGREDESSPLKERLSYLAKHVSYLGYVAAFMIMASYLIKCIFIDSAWDPALFIPKLKDARFIVSSLINAVTLGVSVIVVAVPEGLPMMITVVLSSNMKKMLRGGVLVRKMVGIETAGSMNILFCDKTGTLTSGNMSVKKVYTSWGEFSSASEVKRDSVLRGMTSSLIGRLVAVANRSATENAIASFFKSTGKADDTGVVENLRFSSDLKYSACLFERYGACRCEMLGAGERLASLCTAYVASDGSTKPMTPHVKEMIEKIIERETRSCSRVLALVSCDASCWENVRTGASEPCVFEALISIRDELRRDIRQSVLEAKRAGVQVVMMTGDNRETAVAVAAEAGITDDEHSLILTGDDVGRMSRDELRRALPRLAVVSRALPKDKLKLVDVARDAGLVSGMTGDGINDAPALKASDVGFSMGSGSDVAKEASDIVLTNNSFRSITKAILYGRCVFESIRKFIVFQLTMNLCALGVSLIGPFIGTSSPITVIQMLWVNMIMDTLGALAFAGEIPLREYMKRPPIKRNEKILSRGMIAQILFLGTYTLAICIAFLKADIFRGIMTRHDDLYFMTCFFALFIFCGIFNSFNARAPRGHLLSHLSGNKAFIFIIFFVATVQLAIIYLGGSVFRCCPVTRRDLIITAAISLTVIPADQIRKALTADGISRKDRRASSDSSDSSLRALRSHGEAR